MGACALAFPKIITYSSLTMILLIIATSNVVNCETTPKKEFTNSILEFLQANGKKYITFATMDTEEPIVKEALYNLVRKSKLSSKLRSRVLPSKHIKTMHHFHQD